MQPRKDEGVTVDRRHPQTTFSNGNFMATAAESGRP